MKLSEANIRRTPTHRLLRFMIRNRIVRLDPRGEIEGPYTRGECIQAILQWIEDARPLDEESPDSEGDDRHEEVRQNKRDIGW